MGTFSSQILKHLPHTPTSHQAELIELLDDYVTSGYSTDIMIINGYAGTGKSSVIAALTAALKERNIRSYLLAPTGRAAKVISNYSGENAFTIHKKIYRQKSLSEELFVLDFNRDKGSYFIVDEASMIGVSSDTSSFGSGNLLDDLLDYIRSGTDCRLIIVGDSAQLPPVGTNISPALNATYMGNYGRVISYSMTEVVRQEEESGILANATICRSIIESGEAQIPKFNLNFKDVKNVEGCDVLEEIEGAYSRYGRENCVIITRSNKQAGRFNKAVRDRILCQEEEFSSGDIIMVVKNNYSFAKDDNDKDFIANGDVALVRRVRKYEEVHSFRFAEASLWMNCDSEKEIDCKVMLSTLGSDAPALSREESSRLLSSVELDYADISRKAERYKAMKKDPYLNALQIKFGYAITCHKSQGGEWDAVFIDRMLWGDEQISIDLLRWLYTAITRATKKLYFISYEERFFEM